MSKITKKGAKIEIDVIPRTESRATVIAREVGSTHTLKINEINVASEKERAKFASALGDHASAAAILLQELAVELTAGGASESSAADTPSLSPWSTTLWPEPVRGATLLDETAALIRRHVIMDERAITLAALWVAHTHAFDAADCSPILAALSPALRSGKTSLLDTLELLVREGVQVTNLTAAGLFRSIEMGHPTLLIDEADTFLAKSDELVGLLNKGHGRHGSFTMRNEKKGDDFVPRRFSLWAPKAIAGIGRLPATLRDRAIVAPMRRKANHEIVDRIQNNRLEEFHALRAQHARWANDSLDALRGADPHIPPELNNREADSWRPLLAIANLAGGEWPKRALEASVGLRAREGEVLTADVRLLSDVRDIFLANPQVSYIPTQLLLKLLVGVDGGPWEEFAYGKPITAQGVAKLLQPYGIESAKKRIPGANKTLWVYHRASFIPAWEQYLPPIVEHSEHPEHGSGVPNVPDVPGSPKPPGATSKEAE